MNTSAGGEMDKINSGGVHMMYKAKKQDDLLCKP
jgi:hypothetical protein